MCRSGLSRCRGFAMPMVIAVLVILGAIFGTVLVTLSTSHQVGFALDLQGVRAYHAARAGLEWGMFHVLRPGFGGCAALNGKTVVLGGNLAGFRATVSCRQTAHQEGGTPVNMFAIEATGCNDSAACPAAPFPSYVERQLRVTVSQ
jgi:MSHA biogenesis protein MshP